MDRVTLTRQSLLEDIHIIITDSGINGAFKDKLTAAGVKVVTASE